MRRRKKQSRSWTRRRRSWARWTRCGRPRPRALRRSARSGARPRQRPASAPPSLPSVSLLLRSYRLAFAHVLWLRSWWITRGFRRRLCLPLSSFHRGSYELLQLVHRSCSLHVQSTCVQIVIVYIVDLGCMRGSACVHE